MEIQEQATRTAATLAIILAALTLTVAGMAAAAWFVGPVSELDADMAEMLRFIVLALTLMIGIQSYVMLNVMRRQFASMPSPAARIRQWQSRTLVLAAGAEAAAMFAGVVALLVGWSWHLAPAYVLFAGVLFYVWPTGKVAAHVAGLEQTADKYR